MHLKMPTWAYTHTYEPMSIDSLSHVCRELSKDVTMYVSMFPMGAKWAWINQNSNHESRVGATSEQAHTWSNTSEQTNIFDVLRASLYIQYDYNLV